MAKEKFNDWSKEELIKKIKALEKHRYGLVWEDKQEQLSALKFIFGNILKK